MQNYPHVLDQGGTPGSGNMLSSRVFSPIISFIQNINVNVFITTTFYYEPYANKLDQPSTAPYLYSTAHIQHIHIPCWFSIKLRKSTSNVQYHDSWFSYLIELVLHYFMTGFSKVSKEQQKRCSCLGVTLPGSGSRAARVLRAQTARVSVNTRTAGGICSV